MKRAIVTGSNGFVGSAVVKELSAHGVQVWAVVKDHKEDISSIKEITGVEVVYCDLSEIEKLPQKMSARGFDAFYHFAWAGSAGPMRKNYKVQLENTKWTCSAVQACKELGSQKFIFAGSIMEYECMELIIKDGIPSMGMMYHCSKMTADFMAKSLALSQNMKYISAIISNIYGPGENSPRLVNETIRKLLHKEHTAFTAATQLYDFIYIDDAARAFFELGEKELTKNSYYIGNEEPKPLKEFLKMLRDNVDPFAQLGIGEIPLQGETLDYSRYDLSALNRDTGFCPLIDFSEGVQRTKEWIEGRK